MAGAQDHAGPCPGQAVRQLLIAHVAADVETILDSVIAGFIAQGLYGAAVLFLAHEQDTQPTRHATGERLVYMAAEDKFVLAGGIPSIFDAERGKIRGDSLTFFRRDDRVLVEGRDTSPTVTQTRVAR